MDQTASHLSFTSYQKFVIGILAFLQFTIILDFMIMSPLGAILMPELKIDPSQFGLVVSAYAFSAGLSGFLAAGFADRFDRKKLLLFFYTGFVVGTFLCGIATSFEFLLYSRIITGLFGGVIGSIVMAITTDLFPFETRGRVMGMLQTAFAASQILGLPLGLYLSNHWGWHSPFMMIVAVATIAGIVIALKLRPIDEHLKFKSERSAFHHLSTTITKPRFLVAFLTTGLLSIGGYMLMPFSSTYIVNNLGVAMSDLPLLYLVSGLCTIFTGPLVGKYSDRYGKYNVFVFGAALTIVMVFIYTHMGPSTLWMVTLVNCLMFVGIFSRLIPSQALISSIPEPSNRGAFMAVNASLQQIAGGLGSVVAGMLVHQSNSGVLEHFDRLSYVLTGTVILTLILVHRIHKNHLEKK